MALAQDKQTQCIQCKMDFLHMVNIQKCPTRKLYIFKLKKDKYGIYVPINLLQEHV